MSSASRPACFCRRALLPALCGLSLLAAACIRDDEFFCEEAAAHLSACCGSRLPIQCTYALSSEDPAARLAPELNGPAGRCLRAARCEDLVPAGACEVPRWLLAGRCTEEFVAQCPAESDACVAFRPGAACAVLEQLCP